MRMILGMGQEGGEKLLGRVNDKRKPHIHSWWMDRVELVRRQSDLLMGTKGWRSATSGSKVVGAGTRGRGGCSPVAVMYGCVEVVRIDGENGSSKGETAGQVEADRGFEGTNRLGG